jgi:hypothetical protein
LFLIVFVASGCAPLSEPTATFDGSTCSFAGPESQHFNFSVPFVFVNESDSEAAMAIWKVPDGTAVEDVVAHGIVGIADFDTDMRGMVDASAGESATVSVLLNVRGDWLINCFTEDDYPALIFQIIDEESDSSPHSG